VLGFFTMITAAFVVYSAVTTANYKRMRLDGITKAVEFETEKVNKTIAEIERGAVWFAQGAKLCFESQSEELGEDLVVEYIRSFPTSIGGGFWYEPYAFSDEKLRFGAYAFFDEAVGKVRLDDTFFMDEYDYHSMNWYREVSENISRPYQVVWTKPYIDDSGSYSLMTTAGAGAFDERGLLIAVSTLDWEIEEVIHQLSEIKPTRNSFVLLCAPEKNCIISNTYTDGGAGEPLSGLGWDYKADRFALYGTEYMNFNRILDNGWLLSVYVPENEIFEEVESRNNRFSTIITGAFLILLTSAAYLLSRLINRPLRKLTSGVTELGGGDLDKQIEIRSKDEFGTLAAAFNKMTVDLKTSIEQNARERAEKERIGAELSIATQIQANMLPCIFPAFPHRTEFDIYASMEPAKEVGGDFYDFFMVDDNTLAVVIADVSGKGVPAALFMVIAKTLIKNNAQGGKSPKEVFETVNNILCENNEAGMFVTAFMGYLDIPSGKFTYVNAGHNPPLIKKEDGKYEFLKTKSGFVLAGMEDMVYKQQEIAFYPNDELFLYTDGVTEAVNHKYALFGDPRLLETTDKYIDLPPKEFTVSVKREIDKFADGAEQADDITMLVMRYVGIYHNELLIEATLENMGSVLDFINASIGDCPPKIQNQIGIAADEIFSNIARYAYRPKTGKATIRVIAGDDITIEFEDAGVAYNPLEKDDPDTTLSADERDVGGLGIFMVKNIMDSVEYRREGNNNILTIKKRKNSGNEK